MTRGSVDQIRGRRSRIFACCRPSRLLLDRRDIGGPSGAVWDKFPKEGGLSGKARTGFRNGPRLNPRPAARRGAARARRGPGRVRQAGARGLGGIWPRCPVSARRRHARAPLTRAPLGARAPPPPAPQWPLPRGAQGRRPRRDAAEASAARGARALRVRAHQQQPCAYQRNARAHDNAKNLAPSERRERRRGPPNAEARA